MKLIMAIVNNDDSSAVLTEIKINVFTDKTVSTRCIYETEMKLSDFDATKKLLTENTIEEFNADWRKTYRDVDLDKLGNTDILCQPSVEDEYIDSLEDKVEYRTMENAMKILDGCLTERQKERYIRKKMNAETTTHIADCEGVKQASVYESIAAAERKIKKFLKKQ